MIKFIELTTHDGIEFHEIFVNISSITFIQEIEKHNQTRLYLVDGTKLYIKEDYKTVKNYLTL